MLDSLYSPTNKLLPGRGSETSLNLVRGDIVFILDFLYCIYHTYTNTYPTLYLNPLHSSANTHKITL